MSGIEKYDLTEEEFENSLKMAELAILMPMRPAEKPKSVFIISQAGGGKTGLRRFVESENFQKSPENIFVGIDPDEIAVYHKYYEKIIREYPRESYMQLQKFVKPALDGYLRQRAVQLRTNLMQEGTFGTTDGYINILEFQRNGGKASIGKIQDDGKREQIQVPGGYDIEIDILAVDRFESLLSSYEREQYFIESNLPPRAVTAENHDRAYFNLLKTTQEVENRGLYDTMRVFKRGKSETEPELVYVSGEKQYPSITECIRQVRISERKRMLEKPEAFLQRIENLKQRIKTEVQRQKIDQLEKEVIEELEKMKNAR